MVSELSHATTQSRPSPAHTRRRCTRRPGRACGTPAKLPALFLHAICMAVTRVTWSMGDTGRALQLNGGFSARVLNVLCTEKCNLPWMYKRCGGLCAGGAGHGCGTRPGGSGCRGARARGLCEQSGVEVVQRPWRRGGSPWEMSTSIFMRLSGSLNVGQGSGQLCLTVLCCQSSWPFLPPRDPLFLLGAHPFLSSCFTKVPGVDRNF